MTRLPRLVFEAIRRRRSVRRFADRRVPRSVVRRLLGAAVLAPSSMGARPWHFIVVEDRALLRELAAIKNRHCPREKRGFPSDFLARAPVALVVCVDRKRSHGREAENAALAAANVMLLAPAYGLGTTYLTATRDEDPGLERQVRALFGVPPGFSPKVILPVGYPARPPSPGRRAADLRRRVHREAW